MAKTLQKVHKQLSKKKGQLDALHENSRDAKRLRRATHRDERVARISSNKSRGRQSYMDRIEYLQEIIPEGTQTLSDKEMMDLIVRYINRSVPEIEQLQGERRKGRPPSKREEALLQRTEVEDKEFKTGFWIPDFSQEETMKRMASWNGDWNSLTAWKFIRMTKDGGKQASAFPPRGLS